MLLGHLSFYFFVFFSPSSCFFFYFMLPITRNIEVPSIHSCCIWCFVLLFFLYSFSHFDAFQLRCFFIVLIFSTSSRKLFSPDMKCTTHFINDDEISFAFAITVKVRITKWELKWYEMSWDVYIIKMVFACTRFVPMEEKEQ